MGRGILVLLMALAVAACASDAGLKGLIGSPLDSAIARMGFPAGERRMAGRHLYDWRSSVMYQGARYECQVTAVVDARDTILDWSYQGDALSCDQLFRRAAGK